MQINWKYLVFWISLGVIVVVIAVTSFVIIGKLGAEEMKTGAGQLQSASNIAQNNSSAQNQTATQNQTAPTHLANQTMAASGQLISGFPKELILNLSGQVSQSYSMTGSGYQQYTAQFNTTQNPANELKAYHDYLIAHGYKILNQSSAAGKTAALYASKAGADVNFSASAGTSALTQVTITYLTK